MGQLQRLRVHPRHVVMTLMREIKSGTRSGDSHKLRAIPGLGGMDDMQVNKRKVIFLDGYQAVDLRVNTLECALKGQSFPLRTESEHGDVRSLGERV